MVLTTKPSESGYAGWVYTTQNTWRKFGLVSKDEDSVVVSADKIGIGTTNPSQELDVHGSVNITGVLTATTFGNINAGIITGTAFEGDGSSLTGVIGIGSGFVVQDSGTAVGTAATVNFGDNLTVTFGGGISTVTGAGNTSVIFTDKLQVGDSPELISVGVGSDLQLFHDDNSYLRHDGTGDLYIQTNGSAEDIFIQSKDNLEIRVNNQTDLALQATGNAGTALFHQGNQKLTTATGGVTVTGTLAATAVTGDGSGLTGIGITGNTNAETLSVTGVSTFTGTIDANGNVDIAGGLDAHGNVNLGDSASDTLTIVADIDSNVLPTPSDTYDLGSSSKKWKDLYINDRAVSYTHLTLPTICSV